MLFFLYFLKKVLKYRSIAVDAFFRMKQKNILCQINLHISEKSSTFAENL